MLLCLILSLLTCTADSAPRTFAWIDGIIAGSSRISGFEVDPENGTFHPLPASPFLSIPGSISTVTADPTGRFVFAADEALGTIHVSAVSRDGSLREVPESPFEAGIQPRSIAFTPSGNFVYVAGAGGARNLRGFHLNSSGRLTPLSAFPITSGSGPAQLTVNVSGRVLYVVQPREGMIAGYSIHPFTGALVPIHGSPFATSPGCKSLVLSPEGNFAWAAAGPSRLLGYRVDPISGALAPLGAFNFDGPLFHPSGKFVWFPRGSDDLLTGYALKSDGDLRAISSTIPPGRSAHPVAIGTAFAMAPSGNWVYKLELHSGRISSWSIDPDSGRLTERSSASLSVGSSSHTIAPTRF